MDVEINMTGGGFFRIALDVASLEEVADVLRRERALIGQAEPDGYAAYSMGDCTGRVLIPAQRIQMVREV